MKFGGYQLNRREKLLLLLLIIACGLVFVNKIVLARQIPAYRDLKTRLEAYRVQLVAAQKSAAQVETFAREAEAARKAWDQAIRHYGFTIGSSFNFFEAAQPQDGAVRLLTLRPLPIEKKYSFHVYPYEVAVSGPYPAVEAYIGQLESLPVPTALRNLKLLAQEGKKGIVEGNFILELYDLGGDTFQPGPVALFPAGREDGFTPTPAVAVAGEEKAGKKTADIRQGNDTGEGRDTSTKVPVPPPVSQNPVLNGGGNGSKGEVVRGQVSMEDVGHESQYTLPRIVNGRLVRGGAFQEPPGDKGDVWLEELRVMRNIGPFFVMDRPAALIGMEIGRSVGVKLDKEKRAAELRVELQKRYIRLQGYIGVDDGYAASSGKVKATIFADGRQLYQGEMRPGDYPEYVELSLYGVQKLTFNLEWQDGGLGNYTQLMAVLAGIHFSPAD